MFKKALSILLALMLIVSSISITAISVSAADGDQEVTYTVAGSSAAMFGTTWDATNTANDMTFNEDSELYEITYSAVEPENAIQLKVVKNHAWDEAWGDKDTGDNYTFNVTAVCDVTVTFDPDTQEVNVTGEGVTQDTDLDVTSVIAVGNGEETYLNGANWDPCDPSNALTEDTENPGVWKMTMEDIYAFDNYNIKFAINSVDDQGNPTSNPWAHNFGSEVEQLYPTNEEIDAVYNGKNCIFEVEEDGSTVEFTLDLRNFDFKTKKGAKMTIAVTAPESDVTTAPAEETTVAPEPQETTVAPAPAGDGLTVNATSNLFVADAQYYAENPDTVTVNYYMNAVSPLKMQAVQFGITYDPEYLTFDPDKNGYYDEDEEEYNYDQMFPVANGVGDVNPKEDAPEIKFAVAKWDGLNLRKSGELIPIATVVFDVKDGAKGVTEISNTVAAAALTNSKTEEDYIIYNINGLQQEAYDFVTGGDPTTLYSVVSPEGTEPPVEPTTAADTTAADTTAEETTAEATTVEPTTAEPTTAPVEPTTEPTPVDHTYTVAGSSAAMFGTPWDATNTANDMTKGDDGVFTIVYPDVQPEDAIQLKVVEDHAWDHAWGDKETGDNYTFNVVSPCDVTVTFDPATETVTVSGDGVTQDTSLDVYSVIAVGNGEETYLNGANWDPCDESNALTMVSDGIWEMTMDDIYAFDNYNIKFAINSVDSQGNPTSNPWAHNFGSEVEQLYPTGEELDAVYNGKNCIFEVEEDGSTVKLQLDLRNFDFKTKKGAKMTITVSNDEPVQPTTEPATVGPIGGDNLTVTATSNLFTADQATYYYTSTEGVPDTVTVTYYMDVDKALKMQAVQFGITYDPEFLTFDPDKNGYYDEDEEEYNYDQMFPVANGVGDINPMPDKNMIKFAVAKWDGLNLKKNGELIPVATVTFDVVDGAKGDTEVDCNVAACSLTNPKTEEDYIIYNVNGLQQEAYDFVTGGNPETIYGVIEPAGNTPVVEPTTEVDTTVAEPTTVEPTTAEPTTVEPTTAEATTVAPTTAPAPTGDSLTVNATSNLFTPDQATYYYNSTEGVPETVTVTYYMDVDKALKMQAVQFGITYDPEYLTFDPDKNGYYDEDEEEYNYDQMFPVANGVGDINPMPDKNIIRFAVAKWDGLNLKKNGELIPVATVTFDVKDGAKGVTDVDCKVAACSLTNPKTEEDYIIYNVNGLQQEAYDFVTGGDPSTLYGVIEPAGNTPATEPTTEEPTTEEPTTVEPTTEPAPVDHIYTVAGSSAAMFGTTWDASNTANDMTKGDDGIWSITYPDVQPEDAIQLKVVEDHAWDHAWGDKETGDNYTFNVVSPCDVTVTFDPATETVTVSGDGVTQDTELDVYSVIAVGNGEETYLNGANWDPCDPANALTEVADGVWEMTMEDIYAFDNYNIKFAVNSVDAEGNPTSNPWAHNFGSEVEQLYPTGEELDAVYNGKNCIFEVEEDGSIVKLQLDLRNFDFKTKKGAKMTITVETPEPPVPTTTEEPTTAEPTTVEPTTAEPTTAEPTTAEPTTVEPTTAPAPTGDSLTVNATSNLFTPDQATYYYNSEEGVPETVTVTYYMDVDKALQLQAIQFGITYDPEYLTFDPDKNGYYDEDAEEYNYDQMFPVANGVGDVNPMPDKNIIRFAVAKWDGLKLKKNGELVPIATVTFDVKDGAKGVTDVDCKVAACSLTNPKTEEDYIIYNVHGLQQEAYDFVTGGDPSTLYGVIEPAGNTPATEPTTEEPTTVEPTTAEPTTEEPTTAEPTTVEPTTVAPTTAPVTDLNVTSTSNMFPTATNVVKVGDTFYVTYQLDAAHDVDSFQWKMTYDPEKLECTGVATPGVEDYVTINVETGKVRAAASNATNPFKYSMGDVFAEFQFKALDGGDTEVVFDVQVFEEHDPSIDPTTAEPTTEEPTTEQPTTEQPTTEQPTTEQPTTEQPTTEQPTTEQPTTEQPTTEQPTTEQPTTEQPTTEQPTTEQPTTEQPTTEQPTTEQPTTEQPTTAPVEPTTVEPTTVPSGVTVTGPDTYVKGSDDKLVFTVTGADPEDCTGIKVNGEEVPAENYTVEKTDDGFTVTFNKDYADNLNDGETTFDFTIDGETYTSKVNVTSTEPGTTSTDATSGTDEQGTTTAGGGSSDGSGSTSDSGSGSSSSSGAVQTGSASMAIIILLVLVSATAGIYFARKRREEK